MDGTFMRGNGNGTKNANGSHFEAAVVQRYAEASRKAEAGLCVPINYDRSLLEVIPEEIIEKDYGCADRSRYSREGETLLDPSSGGGKTCYIISQIVGPRGRVIDGVFDCSRDHRRSIPRETKGMDYKVTQNSGRVCAPGSSCCP